MTLDSRESFVRVIVSLLYQAQLLALALVESRLDAVGLFQSLQGQNQ